MPECDENIVNIDVFMRLHFPAIFMALACNWRPWDLILEAWRGLGCLIGLLATLCCGLLKSMIFRYPPESCITWTWVVIRGVWRPYTSSPQTADQQPAIS